MDPLTSKAAAGALSVLAELPDDVGGMFKAELAALLTQVQSSVASHSSLQEKAKELNAELDTARLAHHEARADEDEYSSSLKQAQEDVARLTEEAQKHRLANMAAENALREAKARIAALDSTKELGSGWTGEQLERQAALQEAADAAAAELGAKRKHVATLRGDVSLLTTQIEAVQAQKAEVDAAIAGSKDAITSAKNELTAAQRGRELAERELKEAQDRAMVMRHELAERTRASEATAAELASSQEALRDDRALLDRSIRDFDRVRARAVKTAEDVAAQIKINEKLAAELHALSESTAAARTRAVRVKKEAVRFQKLQALTLEKIEEAGKAQGAAEERRAELQRQIDGLDGEIETGRRKVEAQRAALEEARREKDVLGRTLGGAVDKVKAAETAVTLQESVQRNLQSEITQAAATMRTLRDSITALLDERKRYSEQAEQAQKDYFTALEGVKLQELQMAALQRKIEEGHAKLKQQQTLYDSVKADRNTYSKNLGDATAEINEMKRQYRQFGHTIDNLKVDIEGKDASLVKVHYEHHRVEKEKEALRNELTRIQKQVQSCEQILASQEVELSKLNAIVIEADGEKMRQTKEFESVVSERNLLVGQLVKRDVELAALYERLRVQKSMLANGAASYAKMAAEREDLAARLAALKGELLVAKTQVGDVAALEAEAKRLDADLRSEKTKIRSLTEELDRPINIHRWRTLADRDPEKWTLIQRVHALQKRLLDTRDELREREAQIAEAEKEHAKLKEALARQPGPEISETVASYQATLKSKAKQLASLEAELVSYRGRVDEYRRELARCNEAMTALADEYIRRMRAARRAAKADADAVAAAAGRRPSLDEASLLDVSRELAAAGLTSGSRMGSRGPTAGSAVPSGAFAGAALGMSGAGAGAGAGAAMGGAGGPVLGPHKLIPEAVAAVKDEADELLAAYADVLGGGGSLLSAGGSQLGGAGAGAGAGAGR